jgi:hypothetical protein
MKILTAITALFLSLSAFAQTEPPQPAAPEAQQSQSATCRSIEAEKLATLTEAERREMLERSGCCSHHNGVCGCSGGRAQCCDGSLSPSCGC